MVAGAAIIYWALGTPSLGGKPKDAPDLAGVPGSGIAGPRIPSDNPTLDQAGVPGSGIAGPRITQ